MERGENGMTIRQYAKRVGFRIVGKLRRRSTEHKPKLQREIFWIDEAGNEYYRAPDGESCCIVTAEGGVI